MDEYVYLISDLDEVCLGALHEVCLGAALHEVRGYSEPFDDGTGQSLSSLFSDLVWNLIERNVPRSTLTLEIR